MRLLAVLLLACATLARAAPPPAGGDWRQWGSGELRWFGFALYRATLWADAAATELSADAATRTPLALQLDYRRDIPGERLVAASIDEMRRLGVDEARLRRWAPALAGVFPDVRAGERIVGVLLPGEGVRFYHQDRLRGEVRDGEFGPRFFAIWLDPATRHPGLRAALLRQDAAAGRDDGGAR